MGRLGGILSKLQVNVEKGLTIAAATIIAAMMVITTVSVIMRRTLNAPMRGDYEYITLLFVFVVFFGLAYAQSQKGHISIGIFRDRLPPRLRHHVEVLILALSLGIFIIITWRGAIEANWARMMGDTILGAIEIETWPSRMAVPVGAGLLSLRLLVQLVRLVRGQEEASSQNG